MPGKDRMRLGQGIPWALVGLVGPSVLWLVVEASSRFGWEPDGPIYLLWPFVALYPTLVYVGFAMDPKLNGLAIFVGTVAANVAIFVLLGALYRALSRWRRVPRVVVVSVAYAAIWLSTVWVGWSQL